MALYSCAANCVYRTIPHYIRGFRPVKTENHGVDSSILSPATTRPQQMLRFVRRLAFALVCSLQTLLSVSTGHG